MIALESSPESPPTRPGGPAWDVAFLFPAQGDWTEEEYLALRTKRLVELADGCIEILPVATFFHQFILQYLFKLLDEFVRSRRLGAVVIAPSPIRLAPDRLREPDVFFVTPKRVSSTRQPPAGADLAIEVVSEGDENRKRDLVTKRREYAEAGIPEYWIVDPASKTISVLALEAGANEYVLAGEFGIGMRATSRLLPDFSVDVSATFAAGEEVLGGDETSRSS
jgi:Uma2 family endonuclease